MDLDLPRLEYLGQSISYHHLMLIQVDKVESVYVDLKSVILSPDLGLWDHLENGDLSPRLWGRAILKRRMIMRD